MGDKDGPRSTINDSKWKDLQDRAIRKDIADGGLLNPKGQERARVQSKSFDKRDQN